MNLSTPCSLNNCGMCQGKVGGLGEQRNQKCECSCHDKDNGAGRLAPLAPRPVSTLKEREKFPVEATTCK